MWWFGGGTDITPPSARMYAAGKYRQFGHESLVSISPINDTMPSTSQRVCSGAIVISLFEETSDSNSTGLFDVCTADCHASANKKTHGRLLKKMLLYNATSGTETHCTDTPPRLAALRLGLFVVEI